MHSDALKRLIDAVEAGTATGGHGAIAVPMDKSDLIEEALGDDDEIWANLVSAHDGDLNAAKALHDALLPGCRLASLGQIVNFHDVATPPEWAAQIYYGTSLRHVWGIDLDPARAWLLAILRAKWAEAEHTGGEHD